MPVAVTAGLFVVVMFITILTPLVTLVGVSQIVSPRWGWSCIGLGIITWLAAVGGWIAFAVQLHSDHPELFAAGPFDVIQGWCVFIAFISAIFGFGVIFWSVIDN